MAISSFGTSFLGPSVSGEVTALSFSGISAAEIDVTTLASTAKTYVLGTTDGGTVEVTCNMTTVPETPISGNDEPEEYQIQFGESGPTATFDGYIQNVSMEAAVDSQVTCTYTIRITGPVALTG